MPSTPLATEVEREPIAFLSSESEKGREREEKRGVAWKGEELKAERRELRYFLFLLLWEGGVGLEK
jgi:hypothetical protein